MFFSFKISAWLFFFYNFHLYCNSTHLYLFICFKYSLLTLFFILFLSSFFVCESYFLWLTFQFNKSHRLLFLHLHMSSEFWFYTGHCGWQAAEALDSVFAFWRTEFCSSRQLIYWKIVIWGRLCFMLSFFFVFTPKESTTALVYSVCFEGVVLLRGFKGKHKLITETPLTW